MKKKFINFIKYNYAILAILFIATVLRLYKLGFQGAWLDEIHTLKEADPTLSFKEMDDMIMWREGTPHLYFLIVRFFSSIFGHSIYNVRLVSVIFGVISIYAIYLLGKELISKNVGYIAAVFLAINPFHIEYSQEGRTYAMLMLFVIFAFYAMQRFIKKNDIKNALLVGIFCGLVPNAQPIGLVNVISIFLILVINFLFVKKELKKKYFINTFLAGVTLLLIFYPVYRIVSKLVGSASWVQPPSFDYLIQVLADVCGRSLVLFYAVCFCYIIALFYTIYNLIRNGFKIPEQKTFFVTFGILNIWIFFFIIFIYIKSLGGASLILNRYFISMLPAFILLVAICINLITKKIVQYCVLGAAVCFLAYNIFVEKNYYKTRTKSQFSQVCQEVLNANTSHNKIISGWGWLLSFYLDHDKKNRNVDEMLLNDYLEQVKDKALDQETFWYIDGNSRPFAINPEIQDFVSKNFEIAKSIDYQDSWAKLFVSKKLKPQGELKIELTKFLGAQFDGSGKLMFFENKRIDYVPIAVNAGKFELEIIGKSQPEVPINNENAKLKIYINNKEIKTVTLSEKDNIPIKIEFTQNTSTILLGLEFINDFSDSKSDRNIQISKINLKELK